MTQRENETFDVGVESRRSFRVAGCEICHAACVREADRSWRCTLTVRSRDSEVNTIEGAGQHRDDAISAAISILCIHPITFRSCRVTDGGQGFAQAIVGIAASGKDQRAGVGRGADEVEEIAVIIATLRAAHHAGLLKAAYRANHQKQLRQWTKELVEQIVEVFGNNESEFCSSQQRLEAEALVLDQMNRVASSAVITAANSSRPETILSLFDTSAWLFHDDGRRRDAFTETDFWLAWYPGIANDEQTVQEVIDSMPAAPATAIPFVVRLFENPASWIRFRGAIDLDDHDRLACVAGTRLAGSRRSICVGIRNGDGETGQLASVSNLQNGLGTALSRTVSHTDLPAPRVRPGRGMRPNNREQEPLQKIVAPVAAAFRCRSTRPRGH
ncbi:MAG: hypothetical protein R3C05_11835 [Pirellulaceae bacterium]